MKKNEWNHEENANIEIQLLLEAIFQKYGYDFRNYSTNHLTRRISYILDKTNSQNISELQHKVLYDVKTFYEVLKNLSINVTEMFRDPSFYKLIKEEVVPVLKTYPFIKVWSAGCSTGEEVYSLAILLKEEGLLDRSLIYGTDLNEDVLMKAREGIYSAKNLEQYATNYDDAGGEGALTDYFTVKYNSILVKEELKKHIVFAGHNLVTDHVFGEMNLIICRNVFIYFEQELQDRTIKLFLESLCTGGFLGIGAKEDIRFSKHYHYFDVVNDRNKIYQKKFI